MQLLLFNSLPGIHNMFCLMQELLLQWVPTCKYNKIISQIQGVSLK